MSKKVVLILIYFFIFNVFANNLPNILLITTGGTIAGKGHSKTSEIYIPGKISAKKLNESVPGLRNIANIKSIEAFNIGSNNILSKHWFKLVEVINRETESNNYDGIVITHGTDTLEETAYFLNLVLKINIPVVVTGAMRPSTSISADGPANLYNAVIVASSNEAYGKGVLVVFNGKVFSSREVTKTNTINLDAFNSPNSGPIAIINMKSLYWNNTNIKKNTTETPFDINNISTLPKIYIIYEYAGLSVIDLFKAAIVNNAKGIVLAGFGDGSVPGYLDSLIAEASKKEIIIVRSSRTGSGPVLYNSSHDLDKKYGLIPANDLNPQKARILLALSLTVTEKPETIKNNFNTY